MLTHLDKHQVLTSLNHGFRSGYSCETQLVVTAHDLLNFNDQNKQVDTVILDFSKAFDTIPHKKLLHKLEAYGIRGPILNWINSFLTQRSMCVVVEGEKSRPVEVRSEVPQGTVFGPLLFLCHINNLPERVTSQIRLFADDCLLYRAINTANDHLRLQQDLNNLQTWAQELGIKFNAKKCYLLSTRNKSSHFYTIGDQILQQVQNNPYLGITFAEDLKWKTHIDNICKRANSNLGFLRQNLNHFPEPCRTKCVSCPRALQTRIWMCHLGSISQGRHRQAGEDTTLNRTLHQKGPQITPGRMRQRDAQESGST